MRVLPAPRFLVFLLSLLCATVCAHVAIGNYVFASRIEAAPEHAQQRSLSFEFGVDVPIPVQKRVAVLLAPFSSNPQYSMLITIGNTTARHKLIPQHEVDALPPEGYIIRSSTGSLRTSEFSPPQPPQYKTIIAVAGHIQDDQFELCNRGNVYGTYALLELLGFGFLQPLAPTIPTHLTIPAASDFDSQSDLHQTSAPRWPIRTWHVHTQHPLELVEVMNGWGAGDYSNATSFQEMLPGVSLFVEWLIANGQNRYEFVLLWGDNWSVFADSEVRQKRLKQVTDIAHGFCIANGVDAPIIFKQQHSWTLVRNQSAPLQHQLDEIHTHIDWLAGAGFDFIGTESGLSEFSHPNDVSMLAWMNETSTYALKRHNMPSYIKCHCSTGQTCKHYRNKNGQPLNWNFLPEKAVESLGVLPHTVQFYSMLDPAPVYGNSNFTYMLDWMMEQAATPREVVFYGETEYWVSFDSPVPLFLPLYGERRLFDLRLIADREREFNVSVDGQWNFDSGWEYGYWMNSVMAARAVWDPLLQQNDSEALQTLLQSITRHFGAAANTMQSAITDLIEFEYQSMVWGRASESDPTPPTFANTTLIGYLTGYDTFANLGNILSKSLSVAANRVPLQHMIDSNSSISGPACGFYQRHVSPLLKVAETTFQGILLRMQSQHQFIPPYALPLYNDIVDTMNSTYIRTVQVRALYDFAASHQKDKARLLAAQQALDRMAVLIHRHEANGFKVPAQRVIGYDPNFMSATCYSYRYLWTTHSLYFLYRDEVQATVFPTSPCLMNINDPLREFTEFAGETKVLDIMQTIRDGLHNDSSVSWLTDCLTPPKHEPVYSRESVLAEADRMRSQAQVFVEARHRSLDDTDFLHQIHMRLEHMLRDVV
jgi:hypothetical protein